MDFVMSFAYAIKKLYVGTNQLSVYSEIGFWLIY